jgi:circadian clock protein KaiC
MTLVSNGSGSIALLATGIPGFDLIAAGGLPLNRVTLVSGTAGAGKTVFATQFLVEGIRQADESCVFVTLEEVPDDLRASMGSLGWDLANFEADGKWAFVDGSALVGEEEPVIGDYDLGGLLARIRAAIGRVGAKRLAIDAVTALFARFPDPAKVRSELFRMTRAIREMGVTTVITSERDSNDAPTSRFGVEEFVADNVIIVRNVLEMELRRRTLEILKMRGVPHRRGEFPFVITHGRGIEVVPLSAIPLQHPSTTLRTTSGNAGLDEMCGGGLFHGSTTLVSGQSGVGKTLMATEFAVGGTAAGERCLFLGFEESREQLLRNTRAWGYDLERLEAEGWLQIVCEYPESDTLEDRLVRIKDSLGEFRPQRLVLDPLTALQWLASDKAFRDFILGLTMLLKREQITALFTAEVSRIVGAAAITEQHLSTLTDTIVLLRYVELGSRMCRSLTVLKARGGRHETEIREFSINDSGLHIGAPFQQIRGVLPGSGQPIATAPEIRDAAPGGTFME